MYLIMHQKHILKTQHKKLSLKSNLDKLDIGKWNNVPSGLSSKTKTKTTHNTRIIKLKVKYLVIIT